MVGGATAMQLRAGARAHQLEQRRRRQYALVVLDVGLHRRLYHVQACEGCARARGAQMAAARRLIHVAWAKRA